MWKLKRRVLPTKSHLASWGMRINKTCSFCACRQDIHHAFMDCNRAFQLWEKLQTLLVRIAGFRIPILVETIALGDNLPNNEEAKVMCSTSSHWRHRFYGRPETGRPWIETSTNLVKPGGDRGSGAETNHGKIAPKRLIISRINVAGVGSVVKSTQKQALSKTGISTCLFDLYIFYIWYL